HFFRNLRRCWGLDRLPLKKSAVYIGNCNRAQGGPKVERQQSAAIVQLQKGRAPSAWQPAYGAIDDPLLPNQLFGNQRNRAGLQTGSACQVGTGDRLPAPNEVQDDAAVNSASGLTGGSLNAMNVGATHTLRMAFGYASFPRQQRLSFE